MNVPSFESFTMRSPSGEPGPRRMTVGDENLAARVDDDIGRSDERVGTGDADARLAERHQQLAVTIEFEDLKALALGLPRRVERTAVGDPDVALRVDVQTVRLQEQALAEALHEPSRRVEHQNRNVAACPLSGSRSRSTGCRRPMQHPQVALGIDVRVGYLSPRETCRKLCPVLDQPETILLRAADPGAHERRECQADRGDHSREVPHRSDSCEDVDPDSGWHVSTNLNPGVDR